VALGVSCAVGEVLGLSPDVGTVLGELATVVGVGAGLDGDELGGAVPDVVPVGVGVGVPLAGGVVPVEPPPVEPPEPLEPEPAGVVGAGAGGPEPLVAVPVPVGVGMAPECEPPVVDGVSVSQGLRVSTNSSGEPVVVREPCGEVRRAPSPEVQGSREPRAEERALTYGSFGETPGEVAVVPDV
jgi:hypothetical protein